MRIAMLLFCLGLAGCAGGSWSGRTPGSETGSISGPSTAAAARAQAEAPVDAATQARADCWKRLEGQPELRGIEQRVAFVDRCVAEATGG